MRNCSPGVDVILQRHHVAYAREEAKRRHTHAGLTNARHGTTKTAGLGSYEAHEIGAVCELATSLYTRIPDRFFDEDVMNLAGVRPTTVAKEWLQGNMRQTNNETDLAIDGNGSFQVSRPDGTIMYTRNGSFKRDNVGNLVTGDGDLLNPVITIPSGALKVYIGQDGTVSVLLPGVTQASQVGQIQLTRFDNPSGLVAMGNNLFIDSFASGPPTQGTGGFTTGFGTIQQGFLESSNVNLAEEMVNMIIAQRSYEINSKTIQASDEMMAIANNLRR